MDQVGVGDEGPPDGDDVGPAALDEAARGAQVGDGVPAVADDAGAREAVGEVPQQRGVGVADGVQVGQAHGGERVDEGAVRDGGVRRVVLQGPVEVDGG